MWVETLPTNVMKFSIVFDNSGDSIPFDALNPEVVEYYVDQLESCKLNSFWTHDSICTTELDHKINELDCGLKESNIWLDELFDQKFNTFDYEDYLDQDNLNNLHNAWVRLQSCRYDIDQKRKQSGFVGIQEQLHDMYPDDERFPLLGDVVNKIGKSGTFHRLNAQLIHGIESSFNKIVFKCFDSWIEFDNPFPKNIINNDSCNLFLPFHHLGRSQYNKFVNFDFDLAYEDENTFNEIIGFVGLNLTPPQTTNYSKEYVNWCKQHNRETSGELIPLGNIPDLVTNLKKYRIIVFRNTTAGNKFRIDLYKG